MEKIRFSIYVLLCGLFLTQVNFANGLEDKNCPTSPVRKADNKENRMITIHGTTPVDHGTTPVDYLAGSLKKFPSCPSLNGLQRMDSNNFSAEDLVALAAAVLQSPRKNMFLEFSASAPHGTSPVVAER